MTRHLFLTGEVQIGKTTLIQRFLQALQLIPGGFSTYFGPDRFEEEHFLYLCPAWEPQSFDEAHRLAFFQQGIPTQIYSERFETLGVSCITDQSREWPLLVFDECGRLEQGAPKFQEAVLAALDQQTPILGVLKQLDGVSFLQEISSHPQVEVLTVTLENRDQLFLKLLHRAREGFLDNCSLP